MNTRPQSISFPRFLLKLLAGLTGGIIGSLVLLLVFVLSASILNPILNPDVSEYISPIFIFFMLVMVFLASTLSDLLSTFLLGLVEREKYKNTSSTLYQNFIVHIIIFVLMVPVYFIASSINISTVVWVVALHIFVSAQVSALILEIVSNKRYALVGLYGVTFSILLSAATIFLFLSIVGNANLLLFAALPIVWGSIAFTTSVVDMVYGWIVEIYDKDFLAADTLYGEDYGKKTVKKVVKKAKDEAGAKFMRKN